MAENFNLFLKRVVEDSFESNQVFDLVVFFSFIGQKQLDEFQEYCSNNGFREFEYIKILESLNLAEPRAGVSKASVVKIAIQEKISAIYSEMNPGSADLLVDLYEIGRLVWRARCKMDGIQAESYFRIDLPTWRTVCDFLAKTGETCLLRDLIVSKWQEIEGLKRELSKRELDSFRAQVLVESIPAYQDSKPPFAVGRQALMVAKKRLSSKKEKAILEKWLE